MEWGTIISGGSAGLNFFEGWENTKSRRKEAGIKKASIAKQLEFLGEERSLVDKAYQGRKSIATDMFGNKMENLASRIGFQLVDTNRQFDFGAGRTGLSYSGTVETQRRSAIDQTRTEGKFGIRTLRDALGQELMELDIWRASEIGRIKSEATRLQAEHDVYGAIEKERYLGLPDWMHASASYDIGGSWESIKNKDTIFG